MKKWANRIALLIAVAITVAAVAYWEYYSYFTPASATADPLQQGWLIYPNGGTVLQGKGGQPGDPGPNGQNSDLVVSGVVTITWDKDRIETSTVKIMYGSTRRAAHHVWPDSETCWSVTYQKIAAVPNTGSYNWDTKALTDAHPELNGVSNFAIKIMDDQGFYYDVSNAYFTVSN